MRNYIVATWSDADQYDYSGEQIGNRQSKSQRVHFNPDGSACVASYGDPVPVKKVVPLRDKILPQRRRVNTLTDQIIELENAYKSGEMSQAEYTMLRAVLYTRRDRAIELYKKAINVAQSRNEFPEDSVESCVQNADSYSRTAQQEEIVTGTFLDEISSENSLKLFAQRGLQIARVLLRWAIKTKHYIKTLSEV